jgi:hypothetical protein
MAPPILGYPWLVEMFIVDKDTSNVDIEGMLSQVQKG